MRKKTSFNMMENYEILTIYRKKLKNIFRSAQPGLESGNIGNRTMFAVLQRCGLGVSAEFPEKIPHIVITAFQADFCDWKAGVCKQPHGLADPVFI